MNIDILLPTYNGARYLGAQMASLFRQTHADWRILARDDGSADNTAPTLRLMAAEHADKITLLESGGARLGAAGSFSALMQASRAKYIMFCDQDDVWYPDKIERTLRAMHGLEGLHGTRGPLLVHTDARIVDAELKPLHLSFHRRQKLNPRRTRLPQLLMQNVIHGCTVMINRPLLRHAAPIPPQARLHDGWAGLIAAAVGHIGYVDAPTMDYRQHAHNQLGARPRRLTGMKRQVRELREANARQAVALQDRLSQAVTLEQHELLLMFAGLENTPALRRRLRMLARGFLRSPWYQNLPLLWHG